MKVLINKDSSEKLRSLIEIIVANCKAKQIIQSVEHGRTRQDLTCANENSGSGTACTPDSLRCTTQLSP